MIQSLVISDFLSGLQDSLTYLPTDEDLEGAANALLRLQDTYALPTEKIAKGELQGVKESLTLTGITLTLKILVAQLAVTEK